MCGFYDGIVQRHDVTRFCLLRVVRVPDIQPVPPEFGKPVDAVRWNLRVNPPHEATWPGVRDHTLDVIPFYLELEYTTSSVRTLVRAVHPTRDLKYLVFGDSSLAVRSKNGYNINVVGSWIAEGLLLSDYTITNHPLTYTCHKGGKLPELMETLRLWLARPSFLNSGGVGEIVILEWQFNDFVEERGSEWIIQTPKDEWWSTLRAFVAMLSLTRCMCILGAPASQWGVDPYYDALVHAARRIFTIQGVPWVDGGAYHSKLEVARAKKDYPDVWHAASTEKNMKAMAREFVKLVDMVNFTSAVRFLPRHCLLYTFDAADDLPPVVILWFA